MRERSIIITVLIMALYLLAGPGIAMSATYRDAVCGKFGDRLDSARRSGGTDAMVKEMSRLLRAGRLNDMGMVAEEGVRCSMMSSGDARTVVDVALAAGIDRDTIKRGIERHFRFQKLEVPDLGIFETVGRLRLEINVFGGFALENTVVGSTANNEDIRLDGGGGYGGGITIGYGLRENLDLDLALGYHVTGMDPTPKDMEGSFERYSALISLKHRRNLSASSWVKFGIGAGYFVPVMYRVGIDPVYAEIEYDNSPGGTASVEYEAAIGQDTTSSSFVLGLRYYYVVYDAIKFIDGGVDTPLASLPDDLRKLDGSSVEVTAGIVTYF